MKEYNNNNILSVKTGINHTKIKQVLLKYIPSFIFFLGNFKFFEFFYEKLEKKYFLKFPSIIYFINNASFICVFKLNVYMEIYSSEKCPIYLTISKMPKKGALGVEI